MLSKKKSAVMFAMFFIIAVLTAAVGCAPPRDKLKSYIQNVDAVESVDFIANPDQGFYRPIYVKVTESGISYNKNIVKDAQLYHLRIDISEFSYAVNHDADRLLSSAALDGLDELFGFLRSKNKNAVARFAYDPGFGGKANLEPDPQMILNHIGQVCPVLDKYKATVTAVEVGMIGPWGEMHTSTIAKADHISPMIDAFLTDTSDLPVLVRTPKMIYDYLDITVADAEGYVIGIDDVAYRLGIYNDGYLGSNNDLGTYADREKDIAFLSRQTEHLPFGGEVVVPSSKLHDIDVCLPEMNELHLSYLNYEWNNEVVAKWKNTYYTESCGNDGNYYGQTAFTYIANHMGYRFVLTDSVFEYSDGFDVMNIALSLKSVGFGNLTKPKQAEIVFVREDGTTVIVPSSKSFYGGYYSCTLDLELEVGEYDVYVRLYGDNDVDRRLYCLRFANRDIWNETLNANKIGEISVVGV